MKLSKLDRTRRNEAGQTMLETALLLALIAVVAIPAVSMIGRETDNKLYAVRIALSGGSIGSGINAIQPPTPPTAVAISWRPPPPGATAR